MQNRLLTIPAYRLKPAEDARTLHVARIARQIREGTYCTSGREIAVKFLLHEQAGACCST